LLNPILLLLERKNLSMNKRLLETYRRRLKQLQSRMQTDAQAVTEQAREPSGGQGAGGLSNAPMHIGDMGTEEFLQDINATLMENEDFLVSEAREALHRIDTGTFGRCEECGQEIRAERLDALPYARFCTACAEAVGLNHGTTREARPRRTVVNRPLAPADENLASPRTMDAKTRKDESLSSTQQPGGQTRQGDRHAVGTPGGGSAVGGLAGSNAGEGVPDLEELEDAMASSDFDRQVPNGESEETPKAGHAGGAVGGTPSGKRTSGERPPAKG
jgi:RNA polymerase-binding transcription factor DksA